MEILLSNPALTILVIVVIYIVGKELFLRKDDKEKIEKDINAVSIKTDSGLNIIRQEFTGALHNHELRNKDEFAINLDKTRKEINEIWDKIDAKYVSKEVQKQQEERMNKFEHRLDNIECMLSEVKTTGDINASKLDNIIDILNQQ